MDVVGAGGEGVLDGPAPEFEAMLVGSQTSRALEEDSAAILSDLIVGCGLVGRWK